MHVEMTGSGRDRALFEHDPVGLDALDVPEPDDVLDETELLERSMIGVLNAFPMRTSASADAFPFVGRTACELSVELAGVISRMLCDQSSGTDPEPVLVLRAPGTPDMPEIMIEITDDGGVDIVHDTHRRSFPPSVTITDVVSVVLCTATQTLGPNVANLTPRWEHALVR